MPTPEFEEYEPATDCPCAGCAAQRAEARTLAPRDGGHPGAQGARRALVMVTAAGVVLGGGGAAVAAGPGAAGRAAPAAGEDEGTPQGSPAPLYGPDAVVSATTLAEEKTDRATIINRAKLWLDAKVPYSMSKYWSDGYRQDCSGFVSMAWNLGSNEWTGSLDKFATRITKDELLPGDILLFHNPADPTSGSHVTIFGGWTDHTKTHYRAYEQTRPHTRAQATPYGYWNNAAKYLPYRYNGVTGAAVDQDKPDPGNPGPGGSAAYPGRSAFGPGANNAHVTRLGRMLVQRGGARFYREGPGPRWGEADRLATRAFQRAQGWKGSEADGFPGPHTWQLLVQGKGKNIGGGGTGGGTGGGGTGAGGGTTTKVPPYPGRGVFRPGQSSPAVTALGRQLVKKGFGKHYTSGPGPSWGEADRRNVEAFQRAQGWRGAAADGHPGPETWRRLFA
ncbi:peptidoglycan-binding protein [Streptomyces sp. NPDC086023]|uniref:peptidoglycan-binding protein n=1 Tax=Streptomyces sp. NPDC086023 TaxID=3365746 RepID=UPI0037D436A1